MTALHRLVARTPLPVVCAAPACAGTVVAVLAPELALLLLPLVAAACFGLGVTLSRQLRHADRPGVWVSREVTRLGRRMTAYRMRAAALEQVLDSRETTSDTSLERTRALLAQLVDAEETTRAFIAAELHDTVAQTLSQALLQLEAEQHGAGIESVEEAEGQLRAVLSRLRPPELADGDLAQAVADLCSDLARRYALEVDVRWPQESIALPGPVATTVYRFVQETLLNAVVHADGADVRLDVHVDQTVLVATVSDGGNGFDPARVTSVAGRHVGLQLARERARLAGGVLSVLSAPGEGTTVELRLPLVERRAVPRARDTRPLQGAAV